MDKIRLLVYEEVANSKEILFKKIAKELKETDIIISKEEFVEELDNRESVGSSLISNRIAMPHVQSTNILKSEVHIILLNTPILNWNPSEEVSIVILLALKEDEKPIKLKSVINLMKFLASDEHTKEMLKLSVNEMSDYLYKKMKGSFE